MTNSKENTKKETPKPNTADTEMWKNGGGRLEKKPSPRR